MGSVPTKTTKWIYWYKYDFNKNTNDQDQKVQENNVKWGRHHSSATQLVDLKPLKISDGTWNQLNTKQTAPGRVRSGSYTVMGISQVLAILLAGVGVGANWPLYDVPLSTNKTRHSPLKSTKTALLKWGLVATSKWHRERYLVTKCQCLLCTYF